MLDETVQDQKDKYHVFSLVFGIRTQCEGKDYKESLGWNMRRRKLEIGGMRKDSGGVGVSKIMVCICENC